LWKLPGSPSIFAPPKDWGNTTFLFRCPSFFPGWENGFRK
jgi:hypothetical protein